MDPTKEPATPDYDNVPSASPSDWVDGRRSHTQKKKEMEDGEKAAVRCIYLPS